MKKLLFSFLCVLFATITSQSYADPVIPHTGTYGALTTSEAGKIMNDNYSAQQNSRAYQGDTLIVSSYNDYQFQGFKSKKVEIQKILYYSQKDNKNVEGEKTIPSSPLEINWVLIMSVFLYYLVFGFWVLKSKDVIFALALTSAFIFLSSFLLVPVLVLVPVFFAPIGIFAFFFALFASLFAMLAAYFTNSNKKIRLLFYILSLLGMGILSYFYVSPLFIVCCAAGLGLALFIKSRQVNLSKPETF
jgi:hypothetical protein